MNSHLWTSLVVHWLRIRLSKQGTGVLFLVREDSTCCRATESMHHKVIEPELWTLESQLLKPVCLEPALHKRSLHTLVKSSLLATTRESPHASNKNPAQKKKKRERERGRENLLQEAFLTPWNNSNDCQPHWPSPSHHSWSRTDSFTNTSLSHQQGETVLHG